MRRCNRGISQRVGCARGGVALFALAATACVAAGSRSAGTDGADTIGSTTDASVSSTSATSMTTGTTAGSTLGTSDTTPTGPGTGVATEAGSSTGGGGTGNSVSCGDGIIDVGEVCLDVDPEVILVDLGPWDVAVGDVDVDGAPDIVTLHRIDSTTGRLSVLESDGIGGFAAPQTQAAPAGGFRVVVVDGDGDGDADVVAAGADSLTTYSNLDGLFLDPWNNGGWFVAEADLAEMHALPIDGDGTIDLVVSEAYARIVLPGSVVGNEWRFAQPSQSFPGPGEGTSGIIMAKFDFDGDDDWDAVGLNQYESAAVVVTGNGDGSFVLEGTVDLCTGDFGGTRYGDAGDLDGNGTVDLVATCMGGDFTISLGNGDGTWADFEIVSLDGAFRPRVVDLDADGDLDILVSSATLDRVVVYENDGDGNFALQGTVFDGGGPVHGFAIADLDGNGALDVVVPWDDGDSGNVSVFRADP